VNGSKVPAAPNAAPVEHLDGSIPLLMAEMI
jgi:hypothetical protein